MKGQQAPTCGRSGVTRQDSRSAPVHTASSSRNLTSGGTAHTTSRMQISVSATFSGVESRLARSQPYTPLSLSGGGRSGAGSPRTNTTELSEIADIGSALHQRNALVIEIHRERGHEADREIDRHGDGDDLNRLPGLVEHRAGEYLHQIRIADGDRERGVLREVEVLAGQRRDDHPPCLREE